MDKVSVIVIIIIIMGFVITFGGFICHYFESKSLCEDYGGLYDSSYEICYKECKDGTYMELKRIGDTYGIITDCCEGDGLLERI